MANVWQRLRRGVADLLWGFRTTYRNFRDYDAPLSVKWRLVWRNNWIKARTFSLCCGNLGEPGC
ncbi:MAG: hypothetical protein F4X76_08720 [Chloroflexi bacterium]|nr:hypothetical protein [Chloroflexota bacterium]